MTDTTPISFSAYWTDRLGEEIKKRAIEQCPDGYNISTMSEIEFKVIADAINQGIDSHLEVISNRSTHEIRPQKLGNRAYFCIHPEELHVLVRRLMKSENEVAESLASDICSTLGIELIR